MDLVDEILTMLRERQNKNRNLLLQLPATDLDRPLQQMYCYECSDIIAAIERLRDERRKGGK